MNNAIALLHERHHGEAALVFRATTKRIERRHHPAVGGHVSVSSMT
jgi:hypothetical protein